MLRISAYIAGLFFGIGLLMSGMSNPAKVLGFLDLLGNWDLSLLFVMVGAISVGLIAFYRAKRMPQSICNSPMYLPTATKIDKRLVQGSVLFGIGWGLAGFCPGPAVVAIGAGMLKGFVFVISMLVGMLLFNRVSKGNSLRQSLSHSTPCVNTLDERKENDNP